MNIEILVVGRPRTKFVVQALTHYLKHLKGLAPIIITPLKPEPILQGSSPSQIRRAEADKILSRLKVGSLIVALDRSREPLSSEELAEFMGRWEQSGKNRLTFVLGGPLGLDERVIRRAEVVWSLSRLTFSHELSLVIVLEQIYRALAARANRPYPR